MKLRGILFFMALLTFLSAVMGILIYFYTLRNAAIRDADHQAVAAADHIRSHVSFVLSENLKSVQALAGVSSLKQVLRDPSEKNLAEAYLVLDQFRYALEAEACYILDLDGKAVISTDMKVPRQSPEEYAARTDFQKALSGIAKAFIFLQTVEHRGGIYYSHHIYDEIQGHPTGVVVIKTRVYDFDRDFSHLNGTILISDPNGFVFSSNQPRFVRRVIGDLSPEKAKLIASDGQFGPGPFESLKLDFHGAHRAVGEFGEEYLVYRRQVPVQPGWNILYLVNLSDVSKSIFASLLKTAWVAAPLLCLFLGLSAFFLYRSASRELENKRQIEYALRESELRFRSIVENSHDGILIASDRFKIVYVNDEMCRILGRSRETLIDSDFREYLDTDSLDLVAERYIKRRKGDEVPTRYEFVVLRPDGEPRNVEISVTLISEPNGGVQNVAQLLDVTERKRAEQALRDSEEKYRNILETMEEGYFEVDLAGRFTFTNQALSDLLEYSRQDLLDMNNRDYSSEETSCRLYDTFNRVYQTGEPGQVLEYPVITGSGAIKFAEVSCTLIRDKSGNPTGFSGVVRDVTERMQAEAALRESEELYRTLLESNPDPVVIYDTKGLVVFFNRAFNEVFGWTLEERIGKKMDLFVPEETLAETRLMIGMVLKGERFTNIETKRYTKWGNAIPVAISGASYNDNNGNPLGSIINIRDIRRQKDLEAQLQQAQKMEAVGTLASGIAHDFNNLLQAVSGYVQLLLSRPTTDAKAEQYLREADTTLLRASDLVRRLLTFSRKISVRLELLDLGREIQNTVGLLERTIPKMIRIRTDIEDDLFPIRGDAAQIQQVLMNLASNAKDAMPQGGNLTIDARNIYLDDVYCKINVEVTPGDYVRMRVHDTGIGMDSATLEHIFEPFFTTKEIGQGTGLGLSSIYGIIKAHGGHITCRSEPEAGTVFDLFFPAQKGEAMQKELSGIIADKNPDISGTVLLVDDENAIREVAADYLREFGFQIVQADSGESALERYHHRGNEIDAVILDLGMPGMGGHQCLEKLLNLNPDVRVIIASGYAADDQVKDALNLGAKAYIGKPYRLADLMNTLNQVINNN